jgi:hypothetical protein
MHEVAAGLAQPPSANCLINLALRTDWNLLTCQAALLRSCPFDNGAAERPHWDSAARVLTLQGAVVKEFREPSRNQELVLAAFEEEGWPQGIDDPIPPGGEIPSKRRLRSTIWSLNRHQKENRLRFSGDGTAEGVCWASVPQT